MQTLHHGHKSLLEFSALAHEIKQPLAAILSNAQAAWRFLALNTPELIEARATLSDIIADARRADEVIRGIQAFVTTGALERHCLDLNDVVREATELVRDDAVGQHLSIRLDLTSETPLVRGDRLQLRQVLLNLVRNAFEAMQHAAEGERLLAVRTSFETPGIITVAVQDHGCGVDQRSLGRLFHPFFSTKAGGMGLGLALSRSIVVAHGGWIWAAPNPDRGLTVSFTLPIV